MASTARISGVIAPASLKLENDDAIAQDLEGISGVIAPASLKRGSVHQSAPLPLWYLRGHCPGLIEASVGWRISSAM